MGPQPSKARPLKFSDSGLTGKSAHRPHHKFAPNAPDCRSAWQQSPQNSLMHPRAGDKSEITLTGRPAFAIFALQRSKSGLTGSGSGAVRPRECSLAPPVRGQVSFWPQVRVCALDGRPLLRPSAQRQGPPVQFPAPGKHPTNATAKTKPPCQNKTAPKGGFRQRKQISPPHQAERFSRSSSTSKGRPGSSLAQRITRLVFTLATLSAFSNSPVRKL